MKKLIGPVGGGVAQEAIKPAAVAADRATARMRTFLFMEKDS
jgi:hypothetical protein